MDFLEMTKERYSVRKFDSRPVEEEKLHRILEAGRVAPTAVNYQPQRILVLRKEEAMEALSRCTRYVFGAPVALLVCYDKNVSWKNRGGKDMGEVDVSIVTTQMMYAAQELGLGTLWVGSYKEDLLRELFSLPEFLVPVAILMVGYPADDAKPHPVLHESRYAPEHSIFYDTFEGIKPGESNAGKH